MDSTGISFTALYTGHTWYRQGWSKKYLTNPKSALLYQSLKPLNWAMEKGVGFNIDKVLLRRHETIDLRLTELIETNQISQVIEIACGLSPRGLYFAEKFPTIKYIEADLPEMAARKAAILKKHKALASNHQIVSCDIFQREVDNSLEALFQKVIDRDRPTLVITEGLVNYFTITNISDFWYRLARNFRALAAGYYITDLMLKPDQFPLNSAINLSAKCLALITRSEVTFHFKYTDEVIRHFKSMGFNQCLVFRPGDLLNDAAGANGNSAAPVYVVEASIDPRLSSKQV